MEWVAAQFWAAVVIAVVGLAALRYNYLLVASQYDPHVIVYSKADQSRPTAILLIIENVGRGVAKDITFKSSRPVPYAAFGITAADAKPPDEYDAGALSSGIPALGPSAQRVMLWGQFGGLYAALGQTTIEITAAYRSDGFGTWGPTEHTTVSVVEVFSYLKTEAVDPDGARQSAKQLKRIADLLEQRLPRRRV